MLGKEQPGDVVTSDSGGSLRQSPLSYQQVIYSQCLINGAIYRLLQFGRVLKSHSSSMVPINIGQKPPWQKGLKYNL